MSSRNCTALIDPDSLVKSIISKMMYTCTNPYCKHRVSQCGHDNVSESRHYNCAGFPRLEGSRYRYQESPSRSRSPCGCYGQNNPEENSGYNSRVRPQRYSDMSLKCMPAAGDFQREQQRGRWVNNTLHNGKKMKNIVYQSESPRAYIQSGPFGKNYDIQYQIQEQRIRRTPAKSPQGHTKISSLIRRDRDRKQ